uniref:Myosin motor domain-containing protein n=1 Tax=Trichuris muris TaxID=70415 RepID=A0A5S6Q071_TRIMR
METNEKAAVQKGDSVWFASSAGHPEPARVLDIQSTKALIQPALQKETTEVPLSQVTKRSSEAMAFEDLVQLEDISNAAILWALKTRFDFDKRYTYMGDVLVSVNPYRCTEGNARDQASLYTEKTARFLPAHLFGFGTTVFNQMLTSGISQSIFPTGSVGSGKSELCKCLIHYLTSGLFESARKGPTTLEIESAIRILESFTNARTNANDNSTRCAKIFHLYYEKRHLHSMNLSLLLLEKFRLTSQANQERNFHVFYQLLAGLGAHAKQSFGLSDPKNYFYLNQGKAATVPYKSDASDYRLLEAAMEAVKIKSDHMHCITRLLAAILHLGNIYFEEEEDESGTKSISVGNIDEVQWSAYLLQMDPDILIRKLTTKVVESNEEKTVQRLSLDRALDMRDALAKELYASLVSWLVFRINKSLGDCCGGKSISVVDMFGFEWYKTNGFEQLCVNYVNEKVQQYFVRVSFCTEQLEYNEEEIAWNQSIGHSLANDTVIHLLSKKPNGILQLLADECNFPKGCDESFVVKCDSCHQDNDLYSKRKESAHEFTIQHFFGPLRYNAHGYVEKNRQFVNSHVLSILQESQNTLVRQILGQVTLNFENELSEKAMASSKKVQATVTAALQKDAEQLLCLLDKSFTHFVRCLNPNKRKDPETFDLTFVQLQVKALGLLETLKMQKFGFPYRLTHAEFLKKYSFLRDREPANDRAEQRSHCLKILGTVVKEHSHEYRIGKTKVFMKESVLEYLDKTVEKRLESVVSTVQRFCRGFVVRRRYKQCREAIIAIQSCIRGRNARMHFARVKLLVREKALQSARQSKVLNAFRAMADASHSNEQMKRFDAMVAVVDHIPLPTALSELIYHRSGVIPEQYVVRDDLGLPFREQELVVPHDLYHYPFEKFVDLCFKYHSWKSRRDPIITPFLHKDNDNDIELSLMLFKLILRYMNDSSLLEDQEILLANFIIKQGIDHAILRDEIYSQIINQLHENPKEVNADRGWRLMALCSSCFPPSSAMFKYILNFVMNSECDGFQKLVKNKLLHSVHDENTTCRSHPPTILEHRAIKCKARMTLSSYLHDGTKVKSQVESWTKAEDFANLSLQQWGFHDHSGWTVSIENQTTALHLSGNHYLLDFISYLEQPLELRSNQADYFVTTKHDGMADLRGLTASERLDALHERRRCSSLSDKEFTGGKQQFGNQKRVMRSGQGNMITRLA